MELESKQRAVAQLIEGEAIDDNERVAVCIKGAVNGFPATLEAFMPGWPWSCTYTVQTNLLDNQQQSSDDHAKISIVPRMGKGFGISFVAHVFLFEAKGFSVGDKRLESQLIFSWDNREPALRFIRYPEVGEILLHLAKYCKVRELIVKTDSGIYLEQGQNFKALDMDVCQSTFNYMGQLAKVLVNAFQ